MSPFVVSVKDTAGEWTTIVAVEVHVADPVVVRSTTAAVLVLADPVRHLAELQSERGGGDDEREDPADGRDTHG